MCKLWINEVHLAYGARLREKRHKETLHEELVHTTKNILNIAFADLYPGKVLPIIGEKYKACITKQKNLKLIFRNVQ